MPARLRRTRRSRRLGLVRHATGALLVLSSVASGAPSPASSAISTPRLPAVAVASQTPNLTVALEPGRIGYLTVVIHGPVGASVAVTEAGTATAPRVAVTTVTLQQPTVRLRNAVAWRCSDLAPTIEVAEQSAYGGVPESRASTSTPSCAGRLTVAVVPTRLHVDYPVTVEVYDKWGRGGLNVRACVGGNPGRCVTRILQVRRPTFFRLRPRLPGNRQIVVSDDYQQIVEHVRVQAGRPLLLATGDSEMQVLDDYLSSDLAHTAGARVLGDARQSTALTSPSVFNWTAHAEQQVVSDRPDLVAMFLGGNEGFAIDGTPCCSAAWSRLYARLVGRLMATYRQHGAAAVYWFLIPTPRKPAFVTLVNAVNRGIIGAASRFPHGVHTFDLGPTFSPGGGYLDSLRYRGRSITVHEADGFHLSASADQIVAHLFIARLRHDGLLP